MQHMMKPREGKLLFKKKEEANAEAEVKIKAEEANRVAFKSERRAPIDNTLRAAGSALNLEKERLQKLKDLEEINQVLRSSSNQNFGSTERHISRLVKQIRGTKYNVSTKATEFIKIFNDPCCPLTISIASFAKKIVSRCEGPDNAAFACGHVIVLVTSQFPQAMDPLIAELRRACIYTVPKHISYSKTEVADCRNVHGLEEGWAWLDMFLNALPANIYTAVALNAFLQMAGFALLGKYESQFMKKLNIISENFLNALRDQQDPELRCITDQIQSYLEEKKFLQEPEGRTLQGFLLSSFMVP